MPEPRRHGNHRAEPEESEAGLPDGWMEWGGELMFVAGFTSGGAPYGVRLQDFPPDELPDELKDLAAERRASEARLSAFDAEERARPGEGPVDDRDVPF